MTKYCHSCGRQLEDRDKYCDVCGKPSEMMSRDLDQDKWIFLDRELLDGVIRGAFGHAGFYRGEKDDPLREKLRERLRDLLRKYAVAYESYVSDETHNNNILELTGTLSQEFGGVMKDGRFPIGVAQKSLNLYLKYLWCMGRIRTPPHCGAHTQRRVRRARKDLQLDSLSSLSLQCCELSQKQFR